MLLLATRLSRSHSLRFSNIHKSGYFLFAVVEESCLNVECKKCIKFQTDHFNYANVPNCHSFRVQNVAHPHCISLIGLLQLEITYTPYWNAKECPRLQNKTQVTRNCDFSLFTLTSGVLPHSFALQYVGFCTM